MRGISNCRLQISNLPSEISISDPEGPSSLLQSHTLLAHTVLQLRNPVLFSLAVSSKSQLPAKFAGSLMLLIGIFCLEFWWLLAKDRLASNFVKVFWADMFDCGFVLARELSGKMRLGREIVAWKHLAQDMLMKAREKPGSN
jgi:hypothetical protein